MSEAEDPMDGGREGEDDGNIGLGPDPFLQPPILKVFFEQLPLEDLAKCRLVSKLWCKESLSTWRYKVTLKFGCRGIVSRRDYGSRHTTSIGEFLDLWEAAEWGSCPFKRFKLCNWNFKAEDVEQRRFLDLVGGHVTSLILFECSFVGRNNFRRIIYQAFPKLQFLKMDSCEVDEFAYCYSVEQILYKEPAFGVHDLKSLDISDCLPDSMMNILSHFHKLNSLRMTVEGRGDYRGLLETISLIRTQDQTKLPLKKFDVDLLGYAGTGQSPASCIELTKLYDQLHLPLQRLKIYFDPEEEDEDIDWDFNDVIRHILLSHSSTLKQFEFIGSGAPELYKSFPFGFYLKNLKTLALGCFTENFNFLKYTPNLRTLEIVANSQSMEESDNLFSNSTQLEIEDWKMPSLTVLKLFFLPLSLCNLRKLVKWMPNVERVWGLELDDAKFSMVCGNWRKLEGLVDCGGELTDEGVIGRENAHDVDDDGGSPSCANITKLINLTYFQTFSSKLTSASVHDGFLKLASLDFLSLGHSTKFDDEAKAALGMRDITLHISPI